MQCPGCVIIQKTNKNVPLALDLSFYSGILTLFSSFPHILYVMIQFIRMCPVVMVYSQKFNFVALGMPLFYLLTSSIPITSGLDSVLLKCI